MSRALVLVDVQEDYFPGGAHPLVGPEAAEAAAARVLGAFRASGEPVVHVQHQAGPDGGFLVAGTPGAAIRPAVAPRGDEPVVTKSAPNAFLGTDLQERLAALGADEVVVAGMMSSMCVDATARSAAERGLSVVVVTDACAAPDLEQGGTAVPGAQVHAAFMAALGQGCARLVTAEELAGEVSSA